MEETANVPCGSCNLCCKKTLVLLLPDHGDKPETYETEPFDEGRVLKWKPNGDCFYLGEKGCTIHGRAPFMCRIFDCREQHRMYTKEQRQDMVRKGMLDQLVLRRGAILIHQEQKRRDG